MMKNKIVSIFLVVIICLMTISSIMGLSSNNKNTVYYTSSIPDDFEMLLYCGGFDTWNPIYLLYTNVTGNAFYYILESEDRITGDFSLISRFNFTEEEMDSIWNAIVANDFFNLNDNYVRESVHDGTFANITITGNEITHSVQTENIDIFEFDNIVNIVDSYTPEDVFLYYNALLKHAPLKPGNITGTENGNPRNEYSYTSVGFDVDDDDIYFLFDWGDGTDSGWQGPYKSGENITLQHSWNLKGNYNVKVKSIDDPNSDGDLSDGDESEWSNPLSISMPKTKEIMKSYILRLIERIVQRFHFLENILIIPEVPEISFDSSVLNNGGYDPKSGTRGKIEKCAITIEIHIVIYGKWVDQASAQDIKTMEDKITNDIEDKWNRDEWDKNKDGKPDGEPPWRVQCKEDCTLKEPGCTVKIDAKVYVIKNATGSDLPTGGQAKPKWEGYHWIRLADPRKPEGANVLAWNNNLPQPNNGMETTGVFNVNDLIGVYAHEAGHLMGLEDQYVTIDLELPIIIDGDALTIKINIPKEGKAGNIMADPVNGWPSQEDIDNIVKSSGIECPCECCPEEEDTTDPLVVILEPEDNEVVSSPITCLGYVSDDESGIVLIEYLLEWDGGLYSGEPLTYDTPKYYVEFSLGPIILEELLDPDDEWFRITINATDAADNTGSDSITVYRETGEDNTPPVTVKEVGQPNEEGGYIIWPFTPVTFTATDGEGSGVAYISIEIAWDNNDDGIWDEQFLYTVENDMVTIFMQDFGILHGLIELRWYAEDNAGNVEDMKYQQHVIYA